MLALTSRPVTLFFTFLAGLLLVVEIGIRLRLATSDIDEQRQSLIESARDGLTVLLSFLLGFTLPMTLPHYEQRRELVIQEANAISTVEQRAQLLPEPSRGRIGALLRQYVDARLEFAKLLNEQAVQASSARAKVLQSEMWKESVEMVRQNPNLNTTPIFVQAVGALGDLNEERLAAFERRLPATIWFVLALISVMACFVVGYSMGRRLFLAMLVMPLTVAIVLSLVSELDSPRTGFIRVGQQSMERLQLDLRSGVPGNK